MYKNTFLLSVIIIAFLSIVSCENTQHSESAKKKQAIKQQAPKKQHPKKEKPLSGLSEATAGQIFAEYAKNHLENRVVIITTHGNIELELFDDTPIHRANFIHLAKHHLFDDAVFYRVIQDFVVQGGNSDNATLQYKRSNLGGYTLPPELHAHHKHVKGAVAMARGYDDNPEKRSAPFSFYLVHAQSIPHLDGQHTVFGKITKGMEVMEKIANLPTDDGNWPIEDVYIKTVKIVEE